jgi:hypothetical protein
MKTLLVFFLAGVAAAGAIPETSFAQTANTETLKEEKRLELPRPGAAVPLRPHDAWTSDIGGPVFVAVAPVKLLPGGMSNAATGYTVQNVFVLDRASSKALSLETGSSRLQLNFSASF